MNTTAYGPFATAVALVVAMVSATTAIRVAVSGRYESWRPTDSALPGRLLSGVVAVSIIVLVGTYVFITPSSMPYFFAVAAIASLGTSFGLIPRYQRGLREYVEQRPLVDERGNQTGTERFVKGRSLTPEAGKLFEAARRTHKGLTLDQFLTGTNPPYNYSLLWLDADRAEVEEGLSRMLVMILSSLVLAAVFAAFCLQVFLSHSRPGFDLAAWEKSNTRESLSGKPPIVDAEVSVL